MIKLNIDNKEELKATFTDIISKSGDNEEIMTSLKNIMEKLVDETDDVVYKKEDVYDGEELWKEKYQKMREKYIDTFLSGDIIKDNKEDEVLPEKEPEEIQINDLFKEETDV